jgi:hypothetical protein
VRSDPRNTRLERHHGTVRIIAVKTLSYVRASRRIRENGTQSVWGGKRMVILHNTPNAAGMQTGRCHMHSRPAASYSKCSMSPEFTVDELYLHKSTHDPHDSTSCFSLHSVIVATRTASQGDPNPLAQMALLSSSCHSSALDT